MKLVFITVLAVCFFGYDFVDAQGDPFYAERRASLGNSQTWKGKNGKAFRGTFLKFEADTVFVMKDRGDTLYEIALDNLHEDTKKWFLGEWEKREAERKGREDKKAGIAPKGVKLVPGKVLDMRRGGLVDATGFRLVEDGKANRSIVPNFNQSDYGKKASDCVPNSFAMFVAWWDVSGWLKIEEKEDDYIERVEWIHQRLARKMGTRNNSGTSVWGAADELTDFFTDEVKSKVAFTYEIVEDYRPENLAQYVKGANCTVLCVSTFYGRRAHGGHAVALKSLSEDGTIEFNTWGQAMKGKLKAVPDSEKYKRVRVTDEKGRMTQEVIKLPQYEIELINRTTLPEWFVNNEVRFVLHPEQVDNLVVLTPYLPVEKVGAE